MALNLLSDELCEAAASLFSPLAVKHEVNDSTAAQTSAAEGLRGSTRTLLEGSYGEQFEFVREGEIYLEKGE